MRAFHALRRSACLVSTHPITMTEQSKLQSATSVSVQIVPSDYRCRYWAKLIRANTPLPLPSDVMSATSLPGDYLLRGDEELFPGDVLFEGEENHPYKKRGWSYWLRYVKPDGGLLVYRSGFSPQKIAAKAQGLSPSLLAGSGDIAGAVRVAHALRVGMALPGAR